MINIKTMNKLGRDDELIKRVLINRGYDKDIIDALLETGYSNELPVYNDLTNCLKINIDNLRVLCYYLHNKGETYGKIYYK